MNDLSAAIRSLNANHVSLTTTVASIQPKDVPRLKFLVFTGEAITRKLIGKMGRSFESDKYVWTCGMHYILH